MSKDEQFWRYEEEYYSQDDRKEFRKERKLASGNDRSKYKKSDQDQLKKQIKEDTCSDLKRGRVLAIMPEGILVASDDREYLCSLKGSLKQDKNRIKNLVAVGDFVRFEEIPKIGQNDLGYKGVIAQVEERYSILSRADNLSRNKEQLIAVNIDQVLITASVVLPSLKYSLIDRYIIAAQKGNMIPIIVINKIDLLSSSPEEQALFEEFVNVYRSLNFTVIPISTNTGDGIEELKLAMHGKTSVFSGQSGVGKTSLINSVTGMQLATGEMVLRTKKGSHTTTTTQLVPLEGGGFCIDTPGIKSFGLWDFESDEVAAYFSEIFALSGQCKYLDCAHLDEPDCAVKKAVEEEKISSLRFASYCALMSSLSEEHCQR
jgi:ribosome biogenesis GTPase / thiamine phosphate phosphatase